MDMEAVDCKFAWETFVEGNPAASRCLGPVLLRGEVRHAVFWVSFVHQVAPPLELRAVPIPTGVVSSLAGDAPEFTSVLARVRVVLPSTGATGVVAGCAFPCEMPPLPTLHALDRLHLLFLRPDPRAAYNQAISD
jgi:hypothetical protein